MVEVQCSSCHTRYRVDERVLPEGTPTFKCSRCGHVFTIEPRRDHTPLTAKSPSAPRSRVTSDDPSPPKATVPPPAEAAAAEPSRPEPIQPEAKAEPTVPPPSVSEMDPPPSQIAEASTPAISPPKPARPKISTAELLSRPLSKPSEADEGENLSFDFNREDETLDDDLPASDVRVRKQQGTTAQASTRWTVGLDPKADDLNVEDRDFAIEEPPQPAFNRPQVQRGERNRRANRDEFVDEAEAPVYNAGVLHSARFFLGLLLLVLIGFAAATISIHAAPAAARSLLNQLPAVGDRFASPLTPARMVVLHDVHSSYQRGKDGRPFLVIEGQAENVTAAPLHTIGIAASLEATPGTSVSRREVYCGNNLATRTIAAMTPHEIDFFQSLPPATAFKVEATASCPFVIVFTQPVPAANHFALVITRATPGLSTVPNS